MSRHTTRLKEHPDGGLVEAVADDLLPLQALFDVEEQWCPVRIRVLRELFVSRVPQADWPQSVHWNWAYKAATFEPLGLEAGDARVFGIEAAGHWQGVLLGLSEGYLTRIGTPNRPLVYVDFIESAPWNWDIPALGWTGKYRGVGIQLFELSIRWSMSLGYGGRVGLHALPQAQGFYTSRCGMKNLGPDRNYDDLCYFELTESDSQTFLGRSR